MKEKNKSDHDKKMVLISNSHYLIIPAAYVKAFSLNNYYYKTTISEDNKTITYTRSKKVPIPKRI